MIDLSLPVEKLRSVGPRNLPRLNKLGIKTVRDLLWHLPMRYEDYTRLVPIADIQAGEKVSIQGEIIKITNKSIFPRRMFVTRALVKDGSGAINAVWFNQPYIANSLREGVFVSLAGKANLDKHGLYLSSPAYEKLPQDQYTDYNIPQTHLTHTGGLIPIYPETEGVTSKYLRFLVKPILKGLEVPDPLPEQIIQKYNLPTLQEALMKVHYPLDLAEADKAKERLAFDDLLLFQLKALLERRKVNQLKSISIPFNQELVKKFIACLPFELTRDQKVAAWEILKDFQKKYPMNRLMEGDVGSGKTVVALIAAVEIAKSRPPDGGQGFQTVFMAPTEVLANQHMETIASLISNFQFLISKQTPNQKSKISIGLLTSSEAKLNDTTVKKSELKKKIAEGEVGIVIGTHAVIQKDVRFKNLALVVIDEQHRFGVQQRAALAKNSGSDFVPHLLSMTATPIPRTLALTIYGDLDISIIKEKPKNRQKIITKIISPSQRKRTYQFIEEEIKKGRQTFVVCPRIEPTTNDKRQTTKPNGRQLSVVSRQSQMRLLWAEVKAVQEEYGKLSQEIFPNLKVAMLHGKMKPKEKNEVMSKFKDRKIDILVSTSVIEVGVDIPNATIMMIEGADRFGLAQLHQFRGRVGRDKYQSHCLLLSSTADTTINKRLKALVECDDGFELAEKDMVIRGPGEFFGVKQSGLPDLAMASLANVELIKKARLEARLLLKENSNFNSYPLLRERLIEFQKITHFE